MYGTEQNQSHINQDEPSHKSDVSGEAERGGWKRLSIPYRWANIALLVAVAVLLSALLWRSFQSQPEQPEAVNIAESITEIMAASTPELAISAQVHQAILPSIVVIQATGLPSTGDSDRGIGTGVVINGNADVLTALHIVDGATGIQMYYADGSQTTAFLAVQDPDNDIAVLTPDNLPGLIRPGTIGNSAGVNVGDEVFAVGHPFGLVASLSAGVVSGLERDFAPSDWQEPISGLIQFDAATNPGNSGGPLLDRRGQVIGIVTGLMNPTEQEFFVGIGFAVPIGIAAGAAGGPSQ